MHDEQAIPTTPVLGTAIQPLLEARGLSKSYGQVVALSTVDFQIAPGEIVAIVGDNGAGKSTLIKMLSGAVLPDEGSMLLEGQPLHLRNPSDARRAGIETVYQELAVVPYMDIEANMFLGRELLVTGFPGRWLRIVRQREMRRQAREYLEALKIHVRSMKQSVETLSGGQRQGVAVARAAAWGKKIIILDEPTAALGVQESGRVLDLIRRVRKRGIAVVLISHNLPHVFEVSDRVMVMRRGAKVGERQTCDTSMEEIVSLITGASPADLEPSWGKPGSSSVGESQPT
jgi:fructose transport system ATP-binding protein